MSNTAGGQRFRITAISPWASESRDGVPPEVVTFFQNKDVDMDDLRALAASFDAEFESAVEGGPRNQATIRWHGHHYDLDLEPLG